MTNSGYSRKGKTQFIMKGKYNGPLFCRWKQEPTIDEPSIRNPNILGGIPSDLGESIMAPKVVSKIYIRIIGIRYFGFSV